MTNKEKKAFLNQYQNKWKEIKVLREEIEVLQSRAEKITSTLSDMPHGGTGSDFTVTVDKLVELKQRLEVDVLNAINKREEIERAINTVSVSSQRRLLKAVYINGLSLLCFAMSDNYSYDRVKHIHLEALDAIKTSEIF